MGRTFADSTLPPAVLPQDDARQLGLFFFSEPEAQAMLKKVRLFSPRDEPAPIEPTPASLASPGVPPLHR